MTSQTQPTRFRAIQHILLVWMALFLFMDVAAAETAGRIISIAQRIAALNKQVEGLQAREAEMSAKLDAELQKFFRDDYRLRSERDQKLTELLDEKELTRKELAAGLFCSQCKRSKSKIERQTKKPFGQHLTEVNGEAIPMTPEEIRKQMEAYDKQIAALELRYNKQIESVRTRHDKRYSSLRESVINLRVRLHMIQVREQPELRGKLARAIMAYKFNNRKRDSEWQQYWMERQLAQRSKTELDKLRAKPTIERAKLTLTLRIARGETELADRTDERLQELIAARRQQTADNVWRTEDLNKQYNSTLRKRQAARSGEEQRIVDALRKAGVGSYSPVGVHLTGGWHSNYDPKLEAARRSTARALQKIRGQYDEAVVESWSKTSGLSVLQWRAMRLAETTGGWLQRRPAVVRANLGRIGNGFQRIRSWIRGDVVPAVVDNLIQHHGTEGWKPASPSKLAPWVALDLAVLYLRRWNVDEMRAVLRRSRGGTLSEYEINSIVREIDPDVGIHTWYLPHHPGLRNYLRGVYSFSDQLKSKLSNYFDQ
ncbi:MAG: hypothetical protein ACI89E_001149 [Planctomycetota bacterium]|jgi:hypothetical protein